MIHFYVFILPILVNAYGSKRFPLHSPGSDDNDLIVEHNIPWDYFMLVMEWPQSSCEYVNGTHQHHECVIPPSVKGWTLHGLWPSCYNGDYPTKCTQEKFQEDKIIDLEPELNRYWPNMFKDSAKCSFWKHEYEKHGTCAGQVERFSGEHNFFVETMKLKEKYEIMSVLSNDGIVPRAEPYKISEIEDSLQDFYQVNTCLECSTVHRYRCLGRKMHLFHEFVTLLIIGLAKTNWCFVLKEIDVRNDSSDWSYFMLVQRWPQSSCEIVNASGHSCAIPSNVNGWIIHGMWPSGLDTYPQYCQNWTFVLSQVADLEQELLQEWPNIYLNETFDSLWKHEYEKHGTCAASDQGFEHEHDYFQQTLDIIKKYDIQSVLENHGIVPRQKPYEASYLNDAVRLSSTKTRCLWCGHVKGIGQVLSQSYVCLDKKLQQIDCPACEKPCINDSPVFYQPIQYSTVV